MMDAYHTRLTDWAQLIIEPLPGICSTAAALAGLAEVEWTPLVVESATSLDITITGQLSAAYTGRTARVWIGRYARAWGDGHYAVRVVDGRVIAEAMVTIEGYAPARVWADTGPAPAAAAPDLTATRVHYQRLAAEAAALTPAECGPGVG